MQEYTREDIRKASLYLENELRNVHTFYKDTMVALPTFPQMMAVIRDGMIVTIKSKAKCPGMDEKRRKRHIRKNKGYN